MDLLLRMTLFGGLVLLAATALALGRRAQGSARPSLLRVVVGMIGLAQLVAPPLLPMFTIPLLALQLAGVALFLAGLFATVLARLALGPELSSPRAPRLIARHQLISTGVYARARHPMYAGELAMLTGFEVALNSWLWLLAPLLAPLVVKLARTEEASLNPTLPGYKEYLARTKGFLPGLF